MIDLSREMDIASDYATPKRVLDAGLSWDAVIEAGGIGLVKAQTFKGGTYQPADAGGKWFWCLPVYYGPPSPSCLADIVAWSPDVPAQWWRRTGCGDVLGFMNLQQARASVFDFGGGQITPAPTLRLHATPKDYALSDFSGAVVLDWPRGLGELEGIERVVCSDLDFAERVERALKRPCAVPTILVENHSQAEAA